MRQRIALILALCIPWLAAPGGCEDLTGTKTTLDTGSTGDDDDNTGDDDDDNTGDDDDDNTGDDDDDDNGGSGCAGLREVADERLELEEIQCIEGAFEERGYDFDANPCDNLEDAWAVGFGPFEVLWADCQAAEGFGDADCDAVSSSCL